VAALEVRPPARQVGLGIFSHVLYKLRGGPGEDASDMAVPVLVDMVSCPYCGAFFRALTLAPLRRRVDRRIFLGQGESRTPNPTFAETHLANPIECPQCRRKFRVFVGVEYSSEGVRSIDVRALREEESRGLVRWPHRGMVLPRALHFDGINLKLYRSLDDLLKAVAEDGGVQAYSLPQMASAVEPTAPSDDGRPEPVSSVQVNPGVKL